MENSIIRKKMAIRCICCCESGWETRSEDVFIATCSGSLVWSRGVVR